MPAAKGAPSPEPDTQTSDAPVEAPATAGASPVPEPETAPETAATWRLEPGVYEYTAPFASVYVAVPLTAHPADGEQPATVFDWLDGAPDDGRWAKTRKKPTQAPDNAGPLSSEE